MPHERIIVIISNKDDAHIPFVTRHLKTRHVVIDPAQTPQGIELSYTVNNGVMGVVYDDAHLNKHNVVSVWYRKPDELALESLPVKDDYKEYAYSALMGHTDITKHLFPEALWVSDYYQIRRASNKIWQLEVAHRLGSNTPDTLMTSSAKTATRFIAKHKVVIIKTLAKVFTNDSNNQPLAFFARKLTLKDKPFLSGLHLAPAIFQQAIDAKVDLRVSVVGDKVFAASITGSAIDHKNSPVRDWRIAHSKGDMHIKAYALPSDIAALCISHVKAMGLQFGAIDLVLDKKGTYWFLENNPNGQWAFVEEKTGQPIGKAIAGLLERGV